MPVGVFFDGSCSTAEMLEVSRAAEDAGAREPLVRAAHGVSRRDRLGGRRRERDGARDAGADRDQPVSLAAAAGRDGGLDARRIRAGPRHPQRLGRQHPQSRRIRHRAGKTDPRHARIRFGATCAVGRSAGDARRRTAQAARSQDGFRSGPAVSSLHRLDRPPNAQACGRDRRRRAALGRADARLDPALPRTGRDRRTGEGPRRRSGRKCSFINFNVSHDGLAAEAAMLRKLAFLFRSRGHADNIASRTCRSTMRQSWRRTPGTTSTVR